MTKMQKSVASALPAKQGLYDPKHEKDACGVGFVAHMKGEASHSIIEDGLQILKNIEHRGAVGADPLMGDGAGMLVQIPHAFFVETCRELGFELPEAGHYGVAQIFLPQDAELRDQVLGMARTVLQEEGLQLLGERELEVTNSHLSLDPEITCTEPVHRQLFVADASSKLTGDDLDRKLYIARKSVSNRIFNTTNARDSGFYIVSFSSRTIVYKGMFLADQLGPYFHDLQDPRFKSALALVHQRFSTNTFPSWKLSHPYRMVAHNGEINTLRGNVNWMAARQASVSSPLFGEDIQKLWPISYEGQSDTACFDNALEFLFMGGYSLTHAVMMLIPEAWSDNPLMDEDRRAFYEYHAALMEPWDGPAAVAFTDGRQIGATLDRNGLRPARYLVTKDDRIIMSSESGVLPVLEEDILEKWRLQPGKMLLIDLEKGKIVSDDEIKTELTSQNPYQQWLNRSQIVLEEMPLPTRQSRESSDALLDRQQAFGYTQEDLKLIMTPMATTGQEAIGSMGTDTPISALS
ncbi:MAG: glutamate synthase central domain-containing protein, partial [Pseudomonadota bacterium]